MQYFNFDSRNVYDCLDHPADELMLVFWDNIFQEANEVMHKAHPAPSHESRAVTTRWMCQLLLSTKAPVI